jgi:hypothetical protein
METLRHHIIAICSLYRVNEKNSQEKNACSSVYSVEAHDGLARLGRGTLPAARSVLAHPGFQHALKPHEH